MDSFDLIRDRVAETTCLRLGGELDIATAPALARAVRQAEREDPPVLAFDLERLSFMDGAGLRVLVAAARRARQHGRRVRVLNPQESVRRLLEITALDHVLDIAEEDLSPTV